MKRSRYWSREFWVDTVDRGIASFAQGFIGAAGLDTGGLIDVEWSGVLSLAGAAALLSVVTSVAVRGQREDKVKAAQHRKDESE